MPIGATLDALCMALFPTKAAVLGSVLGPIEVLFGVVLDPTKLGPMQVELGKKRSRQSSGFHSQHDGVGKTQQVARPGQVPNAC